MRSDLIPGAVIPDYELSDQPGRHRKLSEPQGQNPMIVVLSRGSFCPKDRRTGKNGVALRPSLPDLPGSFSRSRRFFQPEAEYFRRSPHD
jgi:hypothetical protein